MGRGNSNPAALGVQYGLELCQGLLLVVPLYPLLAPVNFALSAKFTWVRISAACWLMKVRINARWQKTPRLSLLTGTECVGLSVWKMELECILISRARPRPRSKKNGFALAQEHCARH